MGCGHRGTVDDLQTPGAMVHGVEETIIQITEPGRTPLQLRLHRPLEIGRDCSGVLLTDALLSRRHLRVSSTGGRVMLEDLGSTNGTFVDGVPVPRPTPLLPGQSATFGSCTIEVVSPIGDAHAGDDDVRRTSIDIHEEGNVHAGVDTPGLTGVWKFDCRTGEGTRFAGTEGMGTPNAIAFDDQGNLFATDTYSGMEGDVPLGAIWKITPDGVAEQ